MKKTFPLKATGKDDARVRDKIRHEVNKYAARTRRQELPAGLDHWEFFCKVGVNADAAEFKELKAVGPAIDAVAAAGATEVYIEITASAAYRKFNR